ncbi:MAG: rhodanese-like domain-containing protein [Pirellulales bacterium]
MSSIQPRALDELYRNDRKLKLIDVRTPAEYQAAHVPFAENWPLESLDCGAVIQSCGGLVGHPLYVICQKGGRGANACAKLLAAGLREAINVEGGTSAWEQAGLPVVRGKQTISLERQVRIAAGLLVLTGSALGYFVHPYWIGLAAFVGAGLTFAGITDTCGMGMLLARMPWNQAAVTSSTKTHANTTACSNG